MMVTLEARKTNLLSQIEKLKREVEILNWPEYKELALHQCTGSVIYLSLDRMHENMRNWEPGEDCALALNSSILM
jgi:hypothetical protein